MESNGFLSLNYFTNSRPDTIFLILFFLLKCFLSITCETKSDRIIVKPVTVVNCFFLFYFLFLCCITMRDTLNQVAKNTFTIRFFCRECWISQGFLGTGLNIFSHWLFKKQVVCQAWSHDGDETVGRLKYIKNCAYYEQRKVFLAFNRRFS